ncbi:hypothetical protein A6033_06455 [Aeromonas veronii]|nr:hypothetical protein A6033_06455 [Aeromonas veronii]
MGKTFKEGNQIQNHLLPQLQHLDLRQNSVLYLKTPLQELDRQKMSGVIPWLCEPAILTTSCIKLILL